MKLLIFIATQNSGAEVGSEVLFLFEVKCSISHFLIKFSVSCAFKTLL